ncbi:unnamed protein product [Cylicocyclus nassatus]|uniref:Uncharacterized protein n=1 Tax=Cylicocyclus nassatus TaxID=53992 RepID=A0AA36M0G2_CYLNA|nr:unnamed protein product [Cylicocyclus nassatus]
MNLMLFVHLLVIFLFLSSSIFDAVDAKKKKKTKCVWTKINLPGMKPKKKCY